MNKVNSRTLRQHRSAPIRAPPLAGLLALSISASYICDVVAEDSSACCQPGSCKSQPAMAAAGDIIATAASIEDKLRSKLEATEVVSAEVPGPATHMHKQTQEA